MLWKNTYKVSIRVAAYIGIRLIANTTRSPTRRLLWFVPDSGNINPISTLSLVRPHPLHTNRFDLEKLGFRVGSLLLARSLIRRRRFGLHRHYQFVNSQTAPQHETGRPISSLPARSAYRARGGVENCPRQQRPLRRKT